jgi:hypothetical protein
MAMNALSAKLGLLALVTALVTDLSISVYAAETKSFKWTHTARQTVSETKSTPVPDHELVQGIYIDPIKTKSPEFDIVEARIINQDDTVSGDGRHRGVEIDIFSNGDTAINNFEGTHKVITKEGGAWEVKYEGRFEFVGGTGRFKNIKGHGTYRGHITPEGLTEEDEAEVTY